MANFITVMSLISGFFAAYLFYNNSYIFGAVFFVLSGVLDVVDGYIARKTREVTKFGSLLDWMVDKFVDGVVMGILFVKHLGLFPGVVFTNVVVMHSIIKTIFYLEFGKKDENTQKFTGKIEKVGIFRRYILFITVPIAVAVESVIGSVMAQTLMLIGTMASISLLQRIHYIYRFQSSEAKS